MGRGNSLTDHGKGMIDAFEKKMGILNEKSPRKTQSNEQTGHYQRC